MKKLKKYYIKIKNILGLSYSLAKVKFKLRNEGSILGIFWYLLEPLSFFIILLVMSGSIYEKRVEQYPIYLFLGLIMFNFFIAVTGSCCRTIQENANFIKSIKIEKEVFVLVPLFQFIFSHFFELLILVVMMIFYKISLAYFLFYFVVLFFFCLFCLALGFVLATMGAFINDLENIWKILGRLLWLATPIFYYAGPNTLIKEVNFFNPLYHFISIARDFIIFGKITSIKSLVITFLLSVLIFLIGLLIFRKYRNKFIEVV